MKNTELYTIFGAPGCGKTTHLIGVIEQLLTAYASNRIAFVSFTKKGSYEGRDKVMEKLGLKEKDLPFFRTIHSLAFRALNMSRYDMISRKDYREFSKLTGMNFLGYYTEDLVNNDDKYLFQISLEKNNPSTAVKYVENLNYDTYEYIKSNFEQYKVKKGIFDFDDLIITFIKENSPLPVDVAIIDEAQDLTTLQWEFCNVAFSNCEKIFVAGDDDQAIYEWSGADVPRFLRNANKSTDVLVLDHSYRLKSKVLNYANSISNRITNRVQKDFSCSEGEGEVYHYNGLEELSHYLDSSKDESYYFLARNNSFLKFYKEFLMDRGAAFTLKGFPFIDLALYKAIKRYEFFRKRNLFEEIPKDTYLKHIIKEPNHLKNSPWFEALEIPVDIALHFRDIFKNKTNVEDCKIHINTIHGVKGGEADNVVLRLDVSNGVYKGIASGEFLDSELRVLYVACTRAKKNLHIIHQTSKYGYDELLNN